ncbi:hypothetical protein C7212DRAFT_346870 [Tuber magnatum]|uniref:Uncharacterized protein n=1 Tax=Tuber magnatum TaxID=42249 RepID=A0A317SJD7_9PEZI|nr:hypothetical protein C7212DRAFT_346870 [Tuber magnatum]
MLAPKTQELPENLTAVAIGIHTLHKALKMSHCIVLRYKALLWSDQNYGFIPRTASRTPYHTLAFNPSPTNTKTIPRAQPPTGNFPNPHGNLANLPSRPAMFERPHITKPRKYAMQEVNQTRRQSVRNKSRVPQQRGKLFGTNFMKLEQNSQQSGALLEIIKVEPL